MQGATGVQGATGPKGATGVGSPGSQGATGATGPKGATGASVTGATGPQGPRGTSVFRITTAPSSYTTATGGFTPTYRISLATVKSQGNTATVMAGDTLI